MKKIASLLLALTLAALMCFGAMAETATYVGAWTLTSIVTAGQSFDPAMLGTDMTIIINEDGTAIMSTMGMEETGTWTTVEGGIDLTDASGVTQTLTARDGALVLSADGVDMILTPTVITEDAAGYANILANLTLADFNGTWEMEHVETTQGYYSIEDLGARMTVVMADGSASIQMTTPDGATTFTAICATEEADNLGTILWASFIDPTTGEPDGTGMMFLLYDDGQLVWYEYDQAEQCEYFYCFDKVSE